MIHSFFVIVVQKSLICHEQLNWPLFFKCVCVCVCFTSLYLLTDYNPIMDCLFQTCFNIVSMKTEYNVLDAATFVT